MKFLCDVPIGAATVSLLRRLGHDATRSVERLPPTAFDAELVALALQEECVVPCFDLDFAALVAGSKGKYPSVITIRTRQQSAAFVNQRLAEALPTIEPDLKRGALVTIDDAGVRIRPLPVVHPTRQPGPE